MRGQESQRALPEGLFAGVSVCWDWGNQVSPTKGGIGNGVIDREIAWRHPE
jgi:hypothetical protein